MNACSQRLGLLCCHCYCLASSFDAVQQYVQMTEVNVKEMMYTKVSASCCCLPPSAFVIVRTPLKISLSWLYHPGLPPPHPPPGHCFHRFPPHFSTLYLFICCNPPLLPRCPLPCDTLLLKPCFCSKLNWLVKPPQHTHTHAQTQRALPCSALLA